MDQLTTLALVAIALIAAASGAPTVTLVVGYCPTDSTSAGAIVNVDVATGNITIAGRFLWPSDIFGCLLLEDPTVSITNRTVYFDFTDNSGLLVSVDMDTHRVHTTRPTDPFFVGFTDMVLVPDKRILKGVSPTVEESGYCSDGCFKFGALQETTGIYVGLHDIPFKALLDDSHVYDAATSTFWIQGSYDLREQNRCAPDDTDECLIAIDATTGAMISAKGPNNFTVYKYAGPNNSNAAEGQQLAWVFGFESVCKHPYNDYAFAYIDLEAASARLISCLDHNVTVHMDEWISSFSPDGKLFATGSGNSEAPAQLLVIDVQTGRVVLNSSLEALSDLLHSFEKMFLVWAVAFS